MERLLFLSFVLVLVMGLVRGNTSSCDEEPLPCVNFTECSSFVERMRQYQKLRNTTEGQLLLQELKAMVCNRKDRKVFCPDIPWVTFKMKHKKTYKTDNEEAYRKSVWMKNMDIINAHNAEANKGMHTFCLGENKFTDLTQKDFPSCVPENINTSSSASAQNITSSGTTLPSDFDWRNKGKVTYVKDQKDCHICSAFATTGALEGRWAIVHNINYKQTVDDSLSTQELLDCLYPDCKTGMYPSDCYKYMISKGISYWRDYPYTGKKEQCKEKNTAAKMVGYRYSRNEEDMKNIVANHGPVSVVVNVNEDFRQYSEGVFSGNRCKETTKSYHAMLVVGYGITKEKKIPYWILKNSWGKNWGMDGYMWIERGVKACGITDLVQYPRIQ